MASTLPLIVDTVEAAGAEVHLGDDEGHLIWAASHGLAESFVAASRTQQLRLDEGIPGQALAARAPVMVNNLNKSPCSPPP